MENHQHQTIFIKKSSGESEAFSVSKLINSLRKAGAEEEIIKKVSADIQLWIYDGVTTQKIYKRAFSLLKKQSFHPVASRYKLKEALMELGPTGYPFEHFIAKVMETMGYSTEVGQVLQGKCVTHEVDVVATKGLEQCFVECKYGLSDDKNVNVKVPLYIRSRVNDIIDHRKQNKDFEGYIFHGWLVTNTRFTSDATDFGNCSGLHLLSWDYPQGNGLKDIIDREKIYPITVLHQLSPEQIQHLLEKGIVICRQLLDDPNLLKSFDLKLVKYKSIIKELNELVSNNV
ncbi:MAG: restriction endonuclease [Prolixibacteraceae bacterium]